MWLCKLFICVVSCPSRIYESIRKYRENNSCATWLTHGKLRNAICGFLYRAICTLRYSWGLCWHRETVCLAIIIESLHSHREHGEETPRRSRVSVIREIGISPVRVTNTSPTVGSTTGLWRDRTWYHSNTRRLRSRCVMLEVNICLCIHHLISFTPSVLVYLHPSGKSNMLEFCITTYCNEHNACIARRRWTTMLYWRHTCLPPFRLDHGAHTLCLPAPCKYCVWPFFQLNYAFMLRPFECVLHCCYAFGKMKERSTSLNSGFVRKMPVKWLSVWPICSIFFVVADSYAGWTRWSF